jgi:pimeloyl-ACP methyl ester carboxylesterase
VTTDFVELDDGGRLAYESLGEGPVLTLIHPGLWDMRTWDPQTEPLVDGGYRVIRYDLRGYGRSSRIEPGSTYSHIRDLAALLQANDVSQTALIGCSMGGALAVDYELVHPEQVWALVLAAPGLGGFEPNEQEEEWWAEFEGPIAAAIESGDLERAEELRLEMWAPLGTEDELGARIRAIAFDNLHEVTMDESGEEQLEPPASHRLAEIDVPALILEAEHDPPEMRRICDFLAREIMGSRRVVIEGSDHVVNLRQPDRFNELVLSFLAEALPEE